MHCLFHHCLANTYSRRETSKPNELEVNIWVSCKKWEEITYSTRQKINDCTQTWRFPHCENSQMWKSVRKWEGPRTTNTLSNQSTLSPIRKRGERAGELRRVIDHPSLLGIRTAIDCEMQMHRESYATVSSFRVFSRRSEKAREWKMERVGSFLYWTIADPIKVVRARMIAGRVEYRKVKEDGHSFSTIGHADQNIATTGRRLRNKVS